MATNTRIGAIVALLLLCTASLTAGRQLRSANNRIFNGVAASEIDYDLSFLVAFFQNSDIEAIGDDAAPFCTGTLIGSDVVLTAAHCFYNDGVFVAASVDASVRIEGDWDSLIPVSIVNIHSEYAYQSPGAEAMNKKAPFDVAVVKLAAASIVTPVGALATSSYLPPVGEPLLIAGYGDTNQTELVDDTSSSINLSAAFIFYLGDQCPAGAEGTVCAGGDANTCQGDSGGPLLGHSEATDSMFVLGVTSYGAYCGQLTAAGIPEFGYYTDVRVHLDAINALVAELSVVA